MAIALRTASTSCARALGLTTARLRILVAMAAMLAVGYGFMWDVLNPPQPVGPGAEGVALAVEAAALQGANHGPVNAVGRDRGATAAAAFGPLAVDQGTADWADPLGAEGGLGEEVPLDIGEPLEAEAPDVVAMLVAEVETIDLGGTLDADDTPASYPEVPSVPNSEVGNAPVHPRRRPRGACYAPPSDATLGPLQPLVRLNFLSPVAR